MAEEDAAEIDKELEKIARKKELDKKKARLREIREKEKQLKELKDKRENY